nr:PREDICTED: bone morphogenetic protein 2-like [Latimeria chalumnae]|eukprot:XP_014348902.1 PREDICTED: bone morphogenetic protein 2-like [Latimeria chalumnae]
MVFCWVWVASLLQVPLVLVLKVAGGDQEEMQNARAPLQVVSEAVRKLREVFDIGGLPLNALPRRKPPQFMLDLFDAVADPNGITKAPGLLEGNVVRSFEDKIGRNEKVLKAELRVFKLRQNFLNGKSLGRHLCKVSQWVQDSSTNHGFLIIAPLLSGNSLDYNIVRFAESQSQRNPVTSFLVLFTDDGRRRSPRSISPSPSLFAELNSVPQEVPSDTSSAAQIIPPLTRINKSRKTRSTPNYIEGRPLPCQRRPLYVDFEEVGWSGWIISPRRYSAYHCKGSCPFPLGQGLGATNHATVQSIVNALRISKEVNTPCCVPDKLRSINLLYFDEEENVVLKQYDDMVVVSCGCH